MGKCGYNDQMRFSVILVVLLAAMSVRAAEETKKAAVPDAASLGVAERQINNLLGKDLKSTSAEIRAGAAAKLLAKAEGAGSDIERFAMLKAARQAAASAGDATTALSAMRQTVANFAVDAKALRAETISALGKNVRELFDAEITLDEALAMMKEAAREDLYPAAMMIGNEFKPLADRMKASEVAADFTSEAKRVRELGAEFPRVKQALGKLATAPDDPAANLLVGRFLCLRKNDWESGLAMLARGNDAKLKALAAAEIEAMAVKKAGAEVNGEEALKVADGWWDYAATQPEALRVLTQAHTSEWYRIAAASVGGIKKLHIEERLAAATKAKSQLAATTHPRWVVLLRSDDPTIWKRPTGNASDHNGYSADVAAVAPDNTAYLRMRRLDSGESVIIPIKKDQIIRQSPVWCGSAWVGYGAAHLGIKNLKTQQVQKGLVDIDGNYQGWGFGHVIFAPAGATHGYAWASETIGKTIFEISVTGDELGEAERRVLVEVKE